MNAFREEVLEPECYFGSGDRNAYVRERTAVFSAVRNLFWTNLDSKFEEDLTAAAMKVPGAYLTQHRVKLTNAQKQTLLRWFQSQPQGDAK